MRGLNQFLLFDFPRFADGKVFQVVSVRPWKEFESKKVLGTAVDCVIAVDNTVYPRSTPDKPITNRFERITFKVAKSLQIPQDSYVIPINAKATVYGEYHNLLSVQAQDIQIANGNKN